jgi:mRNA-degrading endonuclease RelE of RelBE toxin-antitoxin system
MAYQLSFSSAAVKDIQKLDTVIKKRLQKKFTEIAENSDIKKIARQLVNFDAGQYRLRVGDYRIIFDMSGTTLFILRVRHRREVYR